MGGRDHETDWDGVCVPNCRECKIEAAEKEIRNLKNMLRIDLDLIGRYEKKLNKIVNICEYGEEDA